jgi:hypothetical protein
MNTTRIDELTEATRTMRAAKQFDRAYFDMMAELSTLKKSLAPVATNPNSFEGSYVDACAHFAGRPFRKVAGTGLLSGGSSQWVAK